LCSDDHIDIVFCVVGAGTIGTRRESFSPSVLGDRTTTVIDAPRLDIFTPPDTADDVRFVVSFECAVDRDDTESLD